MTVSAYTRRYIDETAAICGRLDGAAIDAMVEILADTRARGGRLFFLGVGGGAGHASHAVNDFRKIAGIECYTPTDNVSELTARANDDGWETTFSAFLRGSRIGRDDCVFVFSVGGGDVDKGISVNIVRALEVAREAGARVVGVVGRDGGDTRRVADAVVVVPTMSVDTVTPHTESFQAVVWHLIVTHPGLKRHETKWESTR